MPCVDALRTIAIEDITIEDSRRKRKGKKASSSTFIEDMTLWLPSQLTPTQRSDPTVAMIAEKERRLRLAQADDALADIRHLRRVATRISQFRRANVNGTGAQRTTRMRSLQDKFQGKITLAVERYRAAFRALTSLEPLGSWRGRLQPLLDEDVRGPGTDDTPLYDPRRRMVINNGRVKISWIWRVAGVPERDDLHSDELTEGVRVDWSKARARVDRWREEKCMVQEEMRRVLEFLEHKAEWWLLQRARRTDEGLALQQGLMAYAHKQADVYQRLARRFAGLWLPFLRSHSIVPEWAERYPSEPSVDLCGSSTSSSSSDSSSETSST